MLTFFARIWAGRLVTLDPLESTSGFGPFGIEPPPPRVSILLLPGLTRAWTAPPPSPLSLRAPVTLSSRLGVLPTPRKLPLYLRVLAESPIPPKWPYFVPPVSLLSPLTLFVVHFLFRKDLTLNLLIQAGVYTSIVVLKFVRISFGAIVA